MRKYFVIIIHGCDSVTLQDCWRKSFLKEQPMSNVYWLVFADCLSIETSKWGSGRLRPGPIIIQHLLPACPETVVYVKLNIVLHYLLEAQFKAHEHIL